MNAAALLGRSLSEVSRLFPHLEVVEDRFDDNDVTTAATDPAGAFEIRINSRDEVETAFLHSNCDIMEGLPVAFHQSRSEIMRQLGEPEGSGEMRVSPLLGRQGAWDRWRFDSYVLHVQYEYGTDRTHLVTLMSPDVAPRL